MVQLMTDYANRKERGLGTMFSDDSADFSNLLIHIGFHRKLGKLTLFSVLPAGQICTTTESIESLNTPNMKKLATPFLLTLSILLVSHGIHAQDPPGITWYKFFPGGTTTGNYTANDVKQSPSGGYVMVGTRNMTYQGYGYREGMAMRVDQEGNEIAMQQTFTGYYQDTIPWDQVLNDMIITPGPQISYLATGFRDKTLLDAATPPGLLLMEIGGNGTVLFDSLYYNNNLHHIMGQCIRPAIDGGYLIVGSFAEDGGGTDQSFVTRMVKNEYDEYEFADSPIMQIIPAGTSGYATWIQQLGGGYLMGGKAYTGPNTRYDLFLQKLDIDRNLLWTKYYGLADSDEFADAFVYGDTIYMAGTERVPVPNTTSYKDQIYVARLDTSGAVLWENTYGGTFRHFANKIMMTGEGDLLVAGSYWDASMHSQMILMKIDAQTGDSLWTQDYGDFYSAGFRDVIRTDDFGYLAVGRANYSGTQNPKVFVLKLDHGGETEHLQVPRENLGIPILQGSTTTDAINFTTEVDTIYGVRVMITSLLHPEVGDLEISLIHSGLEAKLVDRPAHGGENFDSTGFTDYEMYDLDAGYAPYKGWWNPVDHLGVFRTVKPNGDWTLTILDHGSGGRKATPVLDGWRLDFLVASGGGGAGVPPEEALANFGLDQIRPNPLQQEAVIAFRIPEPGHVNLVVYNQAGQLVTRLADEELPAGVHERLWHPGSLAPGTYLIRLESKGRISIRKALITR